MARVPVTAIDLNLLKVLHALAAKRHVTQAGEMIGLSQPAISHALKRLRGITGDELFTRSSGGLVMTSFCESIMPGVRRIMAECEIVFHTRSSFDPATSSHVFRIGMNDYFSMVLSPLLVQRLQALAPGCALEVLHTPRETLATRGRHALVQDYIDEGLIDLAVMTAEDFPPRFICEPLYSERRVIIMAADNPAASQPLTVEALLELGHVKVTSNPSRRGWFDEQLAGLARSRRIVITVPHFSAAVAVVSQTGLVAAMPESVARPFARSHGLVLKESPIPAAPQSTSMIWLRSLETDAANAWLRAQIRECLAGEGAPESG